MHALEKYQKRFKEVERELLQQKEINEKQNEVNMRNEKRLEKLEELFMVKR